MKSAGPHFILILKCPDRKGVVAAVSGYLADHDASITESHQFHDPMTGEFYMRTVFRPDGPAMPPLDALREGFGPIAGRYAMSWALHDGEVRPRVLIAVSKFGHCLYDLMHRWRSGALPVEIVGVMSNHEDMRSFVDEQLGTGQRHAARPAGDHCDLAIELSHECSVPVRRRC